VNDRSWLATKNPRLLSGGNRAGNGSLGSGVAQSLNGGHSVASFVKLLDR
jgi:hypothetical protein